MGKVTIPYLVERHTSGRTYYTWQPTKAVRALGFQQKSFGTDRDRAITWSLKLNRAVERARRATKSP